MSIHWILLIPVVYTLYAFARLAIDRVYMRKAYAALVERHPFVAADLRPPLSIMGAMDWFGDPPERIAADPIALALHKDIQNRKRAWNFRRFPIAMILGFVCGVLHEWLRTD
jgi:hypothetical protein